MALGPSSEGSSMGGLILGEGRGLGATSSDSVAVTGAGVGVTLTFFWSSASSLPALV